jgi:hypothetical protein
VKVIVCLKITSPIYFINLTSKPLTNDPMKTLIHILIATGIMFTMLSCGATQITFSESEYHVEVFENLKGTQNELYLKANDWMIKQFRDATSVIQHSDKEEGVIIGKYLMSGAVSSGLYGSTTDTRIYAIIDIRVKENKARIEIKPQNSWTYDEFTGRLYDKQDAIRDMKLLGESFYQAMQRDAVKF